LKCAFSSWPHPLPLTPTQAPDEEERLEILRACFNNLSIAPDVSMHELATQTAALVASDLVALVERAKAGSIARALKAR
jgi:peroxin-6